MTSQISVDLAWRTDKQGTKYLVGFIRFPGKLTLDMDQGLVAIIWPNSEDSNDMPQMVIKGAYPKKDKGERKSDELEQAESQDE